MNCKNTFVFNNKTFKFKNVFYNNKILHYFKFSLVIKLIST